MMNRQSARECYPAMVDIARVKTSRCMGAVLVLLMLLTSSCATSPQSRTGGFGSDTESTSLSVFTLSEKARRAYTESRLIEAVQLYQQVVEKVPSDASAWFRLGNAYTQQGAYERAIYAYETSLNNDAQQPKAWFNLSTAYLLNAQSAMRQSYDRMRANDPARAILDARLLSLGNLLHGRIEETLPTGMRALQ